MSLIAEFRVGASDFVLAETMTRVPRLRLELERFIPTSLSGTMPYLWVGIDGSEYSPRSFRDATENDPTVGDLRLIDDLDGGSLFQVEWADTTRTLTRACRTGDETLVQAVGEGGEWFLKIRFRERGGLSKFQTNCNDNDISFDLLRLYDIEAPKLAQYDLSNAQREAIVTALELGYFDVPRDCELNDVADELDLSVNAVSERIRRGEANLFRSALTIPRPPPSHEPPVGCSVASEQGVYKKPWPIQPYAHGVSAH